MKPIPLDPETNLQVSRGIPNILLGFGFIVWQKGAFADPGANFSKVLWNSYFLICQPSPDIQSSNFESNFGNLTFENCSSQITYINKRDSQTQVPLPRFIGKSTGKVITQGPRLRLLIRSTLFSLAIGISVSGYSRQLQTEAKDISSEPKSNDLNTLLVAEVSMIFILSAAFFWTRNRRLVRVINSNDELIKRQSDQIIQKSNKISQAEKQLLQLKADLEIYQSKLVTSEKMAALGELTAGIAHELNNPLNFVIGGVQTIQKIHQEIFGQVGGDRISIDREQLEDLNQLLKSVTTGVSRLETIIQSLQRYSSPQATKANVNINECISSSLVLIKGTLLKAGVQLETHFDQVPLIHANFSQLSQAFINIVVNAIQACENVPGSRIDIYTKASSSGISVIVGDTGNGISKENLSKIMTPFFTTKDVGRGTGLGLSLSNTLLKNNQGEISFESTVGAGTTVTITFPISS